MPKVSNTFAAYLPKTRYIVLGLIALLIILRFVSLDLDPPTFYYGYSGADLTDPYQYTYAARNAVLFDDWNPFDYHRWDVFRDSLVSGFSYLVFLLFGVSRVTANISALLLNLGGVLFFMLGFYKLRSHREIVITLLLLLINNLFFFYGRLPFLENGLIFLTGLAFFIFMRYHERVWGLLLAGFLVGLAALAGKLFGLMLLGPLFLTLVYRYRLKAVKPFLWILGGSAAGVFLYILIFYGGSLPTMMSYYSEQAVGIYGTPAGFTSALAFVRSIITFGSEMGLFELSLLPPLILFFSLVLTMLTLPLGEQPRREYMPIVFTVSWLVCGVLVFAPFNYRPIRYTLPLFLPAAAISGYALNLLFEKKKEIGLHIRWLTLGFILMATWHTLTQIYVMFVPYTQEFFAAERIFPFTFFPAALFTAAIFLDLRKNKRFLPHGFLRVVTSILFLLLVYEQGSYIYQGLADSGKFLKIANRDVSELMDSNAVITGPFAPALSIDNRLKGVIYVFGLANVEKDLFQQFPITHVFSDPGNWARAVEDYPGLDKAMLITRMKIRDLDVNIYRLADKEIPMTDIEIGSMWAERAKADSALKYAGRFCEKYPNNLYALWGLAYCYGALKLNDSLLNLMEEIPRRFPDDFRGYLLCKDGYSQLFKLTGDETYKYYSEQSGARAIQLNPALVTRTR
jgi:4-amino-4-deoxy-L-arabinose transferase-like glycosyltransferase